MHTEKSVRRKMKRGTWHENEQEKGRNGKRRK